MLSAFNTYSGGYVFKLWDNLKISISFSKYLNYTSAIAFLVLNVSSKKSFGFYSSSKNLWSISSKYETIAYPTYKA